MESILSIKLRISYDALVEHPRTSHFLKIIKAMPMAIFVYDSVFDPQASRPYRNRCLAVRLAQDVARGSLAVGDAWIGPLEMRRVNRDALIPPASAG